MKDLKDIILERILINKNTKVKITSEEDFAKKYDLKLYDRVYKKTTYTGSEQLFDKFFDDSQYLNILDKVGIDNVMEFFNSLLNKFSNSVLNNDAYKLEYTQTGCYYLKLFIMNNDEYLLKDVNSIISVNLTNLRDGHYVQIYKDKNLLKKQPELEGIMFQVLDYMLEKV